MWGRGQVLLLHVCLHPPTFHTIFVFVSEMVRPSVSSPSSTPETPLSISNLLTFFAFWPKIRHKISWKFIISQTRSHKRYICLALKTMFFGPIMHNSPVSQYEHPHVVALASSACVDKTTKIITEFTCKDPFFASETSELSSATGIIMK